MRRMGTVAAAVVAGAAGAVLGAAMHWPARRLAHTPPTVLQHPAVLAAVTGVLFAVAAAYAPDIVTFVFAAVTVLAGVPLAAADLAERRLPTPLITGLYVAVLVVIVIEEVRRGDLTSMLRAVTGMIAALTFYVVIALASGALGAGDIRLAGALSLALTWHSWSTLILGSLLALTLAALAGLTALAIRGGDRDTRIPLGPALIAGTVIALLFRP